MKVNWEAECGNPKQAEDLIASLLVRLNPGAIHIDGSGGDGGRDLQLQSDGRLVIWEIKAYPDRLDRGGRKAQITASLKTAAALQPDSWWLVLPMNLTPEEHAWFETLKADYPFVAGYLNRTWLDANLAANFDLIRATTSVHAELLTAAKEFGQETAVMAGGMPDFIGRADRLLARGDEISPHYRIRIADTPDGIRAFKLEPKHAAAPPIITRFNLAIGPDDGDIDELARSVMGYGDPRPLTLPGRMITGFKVSGPPELHLDELMGPPGRLEIGAVAEDIDLRARFNVYPPDSDRPIAGLAFRITKRGVGSHGVTLTGRDAAETMEMRFRLPWPVNGAIPGGTLTVDVLSTAGKLPSDMLPMMRMAAVAHAPNRYRLMIEGKPAAEYVTCLPVPAEDADQMREEVAFAEDLAAVQEIVGDAFPLPVEVSALDVSGVRIARRVLQGETVEWGRGRLRVVIDGAKVGEFLDAVDREQSFALGVDNEATVTVAGREMAIGPLRAFTTAATLRNRDELARYKPGDPDPTAIVEPIDGIFHAAPITALDPTAMNVRTGPAGTLPFAIQSFLPPPTA